MGDIRVGDKVKSEVRPDMGRIRRLFQAVMQGFIVTQPKGGSGHSGGSVPSPYARAKRKKRNKAAKLARRAHR